MAGAALVLVLLGASRVLPPRPPAAEATAPLVGRLVDPLGRPVAGARVRFLHGQTHSGSDGWFQAMVPRRAQWLAVTRPGYLPRTKAVEPGAAVVIRLSRDDGETVVLHVVGDAMAGRRFYGPRPAADGGEPPLAGGNGVAAHRALLAAVQPLVAQADLSLATLATPLIPEPWIDPARPRPGWLPNGRHDAWASAPALAQALRDTGIDALNLANHHLFDALDPGLDASLRALERAGFRPGAGIFGAGRSGAEAWRPARFRIKGQTLALLGCTTIEGRPHPSSDGGAVREAKGGAAPCEARALAAAIRAARQQATAVLVMIHGGGGYQGQATPRGQAMVLVARAAGAVAILHHHPHGLGRVRWEEGSLMADSLGNFLWDQTLWPALESTLLELHLRRGAVVRALAEPLLLHRFRPYAPVGPLADAMGRGALARAGGGAYLESGTLELDWAGRRRRRRWPLRLEGSLAQGSLFQSAPGVWLEQTGGPGQLEGGRDLLWVGDFEDGAVGVPPGTGMLWKLAPPDKALDPRAAASGNWGVRLGRSPANRSPVVLSPLHRIPVEPGQRLTLLGWIRGTLPSRARLRVGWYAARRGASQARIERPLSLAGPRHWTPVRWDLTVPRFSVALGLNVVLDPPAAGRSHLDVDGLRLILWGPPSQAAGPQAHWYRLRGRAALRVIGEVGPGAEALVGGPGRQLVRAWGTRRCGPPGEDAPERPGPGSAAAGCVAR